MAVALALMYAPWGGYIGILTGIAALYTGFAEVTNGTYGREVIPLGSPFLKG